MSNLQSTKWTDYRKCANQPSHLQRMTGVGNETFTPINFQTKQRKVPTQINKRMVERFGSCPCPRAEQDTTKCSNGDGCCATTPGDPGSGNNSKCQKTCEGTWLYEPNECFTPVNFQINKRMIERFGSCTCAASPNDPKTCSGGDGCCATTPESQSPFTNNPKCQKTCIIDGVESWVRNKEPSDCL